MCGRQLGFSVFSFICCGDKPIQFRVAKIHDGSAQMSNAVHVYSLQDVASGTVHHLTDEHRCAGTQTAVHIVGVLSNLMVILHIDEKKEQTTISQLLIQSS